jgi:hypothetical protein
LNLVNTHANDRSGAPLFESTWFSLEIRPAPVHIAHQFFPISQRKIAA